MRVIRERGLVKRGWWGSRRSKSRRKGFEVGEWGDEIIYG
jgi:hypothetical protein